MAVLANKAVVTCGPARLSCSCEQVGASPEWLARALLPIPDVWVGCVPALLERVKFCIVSDLPMFFPRQAKKPRGLLCSGRKGCRRCPHPGLLQCLPSGASPCSTFLLLSSGPQAMLCPSLLLLPQAWVWEVATAWICSSK